MAERPERGLEREQVVAALLEHDHRPARRREDLSSRGTGGTGANDHRITVGVHVLWVAALLTFAMKSSKPAMWSASTGKSRIRCPAPLISLNSTTPLRLGS